MSGITIDREGDSYYLKIYDVCSSGYILEFLNLTVKELPNILWECDPICPKSDRWGKIWFPNIKCAILAKQILEPYLVMAKLTR